MKLIILHVLLSQLALGEPTSLKKNIRVNPCKIAGGHCTTKCKTGDLGIKCPKSGVCCSQSKQLCHDYGGECTEVSECHGAFVTQFACPFLKGCCLHKGSQIPQKPPKKNKKCIGDKMTCVPEGEICNGLELVDKTCPKNQKCCFEFKSECSENDGSCVNNCKGNKLNFSCPKKFTCCDASKAIPAPPTPLVVSNERDLHQVTCREKNGVCIELSKVCNGYTDTSLKCKAQHVCCVPTSESDCIKEGGQCEDQNKCTNQILSSSCPDKQICCSKKRITALRSTTTLRTTSTTARTTVSLNTCKTKSNGVCISPQEPCNGEIVTGHSCPVEGQICCIKLPLQRKMECEDHGGTCVKVGKCSGDVMADICGNNEECCLPWSHRSASKERILSECFLKGGSCLRWKTNCPGSVVRLNCMAGKFCCLPNTSSSKQQSTTEVTKFEENKNMRRAWYF